MKRKKSFFLKDSEEINPARIYIVQIVIVFFTLSVAGKLFYWQILEHKTLEARAEKQHIVKTTHRPSRGKIYSADGYILATNKTTYQIAVVPKNIPKEEQIFFSKIIAPYLEKSERFVNELLLKNPNYVILEHRLGKEVFEEILKLDIAKYIIATETESRHYPEKEVTAHLLGFVNLAQEGQYGLEQFFNGILSGKEGIREEEVDSRKNPIPLGKRTVVDVTEGAKITTTIDLVLQEKIYRVLKKAVEKYRADKGLIVVMNPRTGQINALVSYPAYDPTNYAEYSQNGDLSIFKNPCTEQFEPGSIFKIITAASGIDSGVITQYSPYHDTGRFVVDKKSPPIHNAGKSRYGTVNTTIALEKSLNTFFADVAYNKMGRDVFDKYLRAFGFGQSTNIGLAGEDQGIVRRPHQLANIDVASMGFGQAIAVTPLQMVSAVSAIANGGDLYQPRLIKSIIQEDKEILEMPRLLRKVIRKSTSDAMNDMLVSVVKNGYGKDAGIPGYVTAGKTGTAQIASVKGGYEEKKVVASFIGYAPAYDPQFVMLVSLHLNEKLSDSMRWAGQTAEPTFAEAGELVLQHLGISRQK